MNLEDENVKNALIQEAYVRPLLEKCANAGLVITDPDELQAALHIIDRSNQVAAAAGAQSNAGFLKSAAVRLDAELTRRGFLEPDGTSDADLAKRVLAAIPAE